jgi:hypothetical protein
MDFAAQHGVPQIRYGSTDLTEEIESIDRLGA